MEDYLDHLIVSPQGRCGETGTLRQSVNVRVTVAIFHVADMVPSSNPAIYFFV